MYLNIKSCQIQLKQNASWAILVLLLPLISGQKYEGDPCVMKSISGVCKLASECPELEAAVKSGRFSTRDIVNCGYTTREEIICCPGEGNVTTENRSDDRYIFEQTAITSTSSTTTTTTTVAPSTDFWEHLLSTTPSPATDTTTAKQDFWLHLLNTTTSTTTPLPLVVNGKSLDPGSEFIDLSALLSQNGRRQKNDADIGNTAQPASKSVSNDLPRSTPNSINDRTFGWPAPALGTTNPVNNWNEPRSREWIAGPTQSFQRNQGMPFLGEWRNPRGGKVMWGSEQPNSIVSNQPPFEPHNQRNFVWPGQQETTRQWPVNSGNLPQARRLPNAVNQFPNAGFQDPGVIARSRPNQIIWPSNSGENRVNRRPLNEWQNENNFPSTGNFIENFGPINNGIQNQAMVQEPTTQRWPNPSANSLPDRPIWPGNNAQLRQNNFNNQNMRDPVAMINENLSKSGLQIIKAEANKIDRENESNKISFDESSEELTTTSRAPVSDLFAPFQFRPQPNDYDDNTINRNRPSQESSSDFRFPSATEIKPVWNIDQSKKPSGDEVDDVTPPVPVKNNVTTRAGDRPAVAACREIDAGLDPGLSYHILGGTPVELQEFPHMAAIGYRSIGNDNGPYDYRCGGTLIAKRFVLTAAHCVNSRDSQPEVVLLGLVDINSAEQRQKASEVNIRQVHIHDDYSSSRTYNDVAILELEREVVYSEFIYPTCLYTDLSDPPEKSNIYVSGWGQINTGSRQKSNILLKAKLNVVPVSQCNSSYVEMGLNRRINVGVTNSQMCAHDPGFTRDACQGDSGGPLIIVEDETYRKYRIIGIISAGFSCGSATPGLYARVAAYLDYIERIVWPHLL